MLTRRSTANVRAAGQLLQKRTFILPLIPTVVMGAASYFLGEDTKLANQMEANEVHKTQSGSEKILAESKVKRPTFMRSEPLYPGHVPLYLPEKVAMFVLSAAGAYLHPERNEFIIGLGESTATTGFLKRLRKAMLEDETGREILKDRPYITSESLKMDQLAKMPENSFGKTYYDWLTKEGVSPDTRVDVRYIDDEELAFVFQRYRQCHDFYHAITGLPVAREGEIAVKFFEFLNIGVPFAGMGALFSPLTLSKRQRNRLLSVYYPWALESAAHCKKNLITVYWEKILEKDVDELRSELGISKPPDMRELRRQGKLARARARGEIV